MARGTIEGKRAREYELKVRDTERSRIFDKFILTNIKSGKSVKVCDFACGPGNNLELLKNLAGEITGVDLSAEMIKICKEKFAKNNSIKLKLASVVDTKLKSNYFDYVLIRMGLHHVKDKDAVIAEAYRLLKPNGKFLVIDKYYIGLWELYSKAFSKLIFQGNPAIFQECLVSKKKYDLIFSRSRFKIIKKEVLPYDKKHTGQVFMCLLEKQ